MSFVGRFVLFRSVLYWRFHCTTKRSSLLHLVTLGTIITQIRGFGAADLADFECILLASLLYQPVLVMSIKPRPVSLTGQLNKRHIILSVSSGFDPTNALPHERPALRQRGASSPLVVLTLQCGVVGGIGQH